MKAKFMDKKFWKMLLLANILCIISIGIYFAIIFMASNLVIDINMRMGISLATVIVILFVVVAAFTNIAVFGTYLFWRLDKNLEKANGDKI